MAGTIEALRQAGHEVDVVTPAAPRSAWVAAILSRLRASPWTLERHRHGAVARQVESRLAESPPAYTAVVAEQLQAFAQALPALRRRLPTILRAHNVESDLWAAAAAVTGRGPRGALLRREARRVRAHEAGACRDASAVAALTTRDAAALRALAGPGARVTVVGAPFPAVLPAGEPLPGRPALVLLGSGGWLPNRDQTTWFVRDVWPAIRRHRPEALLHLFGEAGGGGMEPGIRLHGAPAESRQAFAPGAILVVPARIASGLRMKVLEAWARGVAVVATPTAAEGLDVGRDESLLLAREPADWVAAISRLADEPALAAALTAAGRRFLIERCAPPRIVEAWISLIADSQRR